ncbi:hypothetical protein CEXT_199351 [Caerostris extrusa]|uniref:Uncharacterized protein n=1 Tax=Caerostris extrusa TaxID=172846 RepID=A0AAV4WSI5_CAEEX|nr:hypothetical protein CEXT_199351 [Caerostris extrusa]
MNVARSSLPEQRVSQEEEALITYSTAIRLGLNSCRAERKAVQEVLPSEKLTDERERERQEGEEKKKKEGSLGYRRRLMFSFITINIILGRERSLRDGIGTISPPSPPLRIERGTGN